MTDPFPLRPAAQKVLNAAQEASERSPDDILNEGRQIAVAVLKALADQMTSGEIMDSLCAWCRKNDVRYELPAIATELEALPDD